MSKLVLRKLVPHESPRPGELVVRALEGDCRTLASLVWAKGIEGLQRGEGPIERIVVDLEPTLDTLLAAAFCERRLAGEALPASCELFARYAGMVREGLRPSVLPLEKSVEGIYLALRSLAGPDLTEAAALRSFLERWELLWERIWQAAVAGLNPFEVSLFEKDTTFAREQAFLARDHEVYGQDVARGERWRVMMPSETSATPGLFLRQPRSVLFKYWSRQTHEKPALPSFPLLVVRFNEAQWIISTDPTHRHNLKSLADKLQQREGAANEAADPWFDGKPFAHTLVASPRQGTKLSESQVLAVIRGWGRVRADRPRRIAPALVGAAALILLGGIGFLWMGRGAGPDREPIPNGNEPERGFKSDRAGREKIIGGGGKLFVLAVGVSQYRHHPEVRNLTYADRDAAGIAEALKNGQGGLFEAVQCRLLQNEEATRDNIVEAIDRLRGVEGVTQHDLVVIAFAGHGANLDVEEMFYFLPHDFNPKKRASSGVFWTTMKEHLDQLPCPVILFLDTCHSGTVTSRLRNPDNVEDLKGRLKGRLGAGSGKRGIFVMTACMGNESAREDDDWEHGAMTLAFLEALRGEYLYRGKTGTPLPREGGGSDLKAIDYFVTRRVTELAGGRQAVVSTHTGNMDLQSIFLSKKK